jgi:hypothetical protein
MQFEDKIYQNKPVFDVKIQEGKSGSGSRIESGFGSGSATLNRPVISTTVSLCGILSEPVLVLTGRNIDSFLLF